MMNIVLVKNRYISFQQILIIIGFCLVAGNVSAERLKDITSIAGVRSNQLVGYGLVVGLDGTGDQTSHGNSAP